MSNIVFKSEKDLEDLIFKMLNEKNEKLCSLIPDFKLVKRQLFMDSYGTADIVTFNPYFCFANIIELKDVEKNKGIRFKDNINVFKFNSEVEQENLLKYLQTDFARLCLSLVKCNFGLGDSELSLIPWLDFSKSWTDDELFTMFCFEKGHPLREYTKTFLPDYHNIYPNGKNY